MNASRAAARAFREQWMSANLTEPDDWADVDARRSRYEIYWALFENTAYRDIHKWARTMRADYGLYRYVRGIHNPAYRLGEFYAQHMMGGPLDVADGIAGDKGALPILTRNDRLRPAIARLWKDSNWGATKDILGLKASILGDVALEVVDDPIARRMRLRVLHPGLFTQVDWDNYGNVKGYRIDEIRYLGDGSAMKEVRYTEICGRDGDFVTYQTLRDDSPYDWSGNGDEWRLPYGFVPMVFVQHHNVGLPYGWSELHAGLAKIREVDDLASKLSDQIRKTVDVPWLFAGVSAPEEQPASQPTSTSRQRAEPAREEVPIFYTPNAAAHADALVAPLDIGSVSARIDRLCAELERDYPELQMDIWTAAGDASGRALRIARQRVEGKVGQRRSSYDDALRRAHQMAIGIGGWRAYEGYEGFNLQSFMRGDLDHTIGERPVFAVGTLDKLEEDTAFWTAAKAATDGGYPLELWLRDQGWSEERIAELTDLRERKAQEALLRQQAMGGQQTPPPGQEQGGSPSAQDQTQQQQERAGDSAAA